MKKKYRNSDDMYLLILITLILFEYKFKYLVHWFNKHIVIAHHLSIIFVELMINVVIGYEGQ